MGFEEHAFDVKMLTMSLPVVAIVGRPNVGKSSLLNCLTGKRIAIVDATAGVTRDRISAPWALSEADEAGRYVELVDTGGIGIEDADNLTEHVESQIDYAIDAAALIIFLVDARQGATPLDREAARRLRRQGRPVILAANKVDGPNLPAEVGELHSLGFGEPVCISATHVLGTDDLRQAVRRRIGGAGSNEPVEPIMKLAVVGKRNAGKSTFINALAGQPRVIVSETPGTTRDSVDVRVELAGRPFVLIDTAGVRKKRKLADDVEYYSRHRALRSIRRADVVALMIDASVPVSQVDKALAEEIAEQFKPVLFLVNKWDLARDVADGDDYAEYITKMFPSLSYAPISLASATEGTNLPQTIRLAEQLFTQSRRRVQTSQLNVAIAEILKLRGPSHKAGTRPPKILYASQVSTAPPTIVFFVNDVRSFDTGYQRFLLNQMRERLDFAEVPVRLIFRQRRQK